jgi:hypothetical protein
MNVLPEDWVQRMLVIIGDHAIPQNATLAFRPGCKLLSKRMRATARVIRSDERSTTLRFDSGNLTTNPTEQIREWWIEC